MTDRVKGLFVVLEVDTRDDDIGPLVAAIQQMRGVLRVTTSIVNPGDFVAAAREKAKLRDAVAELLEALEDR